MIRVIDLTDSTRRLRARPASAIEELANLVEEDR